MIPVYMDEHVPKAISIGLRMRGIDVLTVQEDGSSSISDSELLDRALELKRSVFTHDSDLLIEASKRLDKGRSFYGIIYAHHLKVSIGGCVKELEYICKNGEIEDMIDRVIFLPIRKLKS